MSKESAMQFALAVMEDQELRDRTAKLKPEEVLSIAKEMGYDFGGLRIAPQRKTIAVFIESLETSFCCRIAEGIGREADRAAPDPARQRQGSALGLAAAAQRAQRA